MRSILFTLFICFTCVTNAADTLLVKDLKWSWLTYDHGEILPLDEDRIGQSETLIFIAPDLTSNQLVEVNTTRAIDIWVNDQLLYPQIEGNVFLNGDQIKERDRVLIYSSEGISYISTRLIQIRGYVKQEQATIILPSSFDPNANLIVLTLLLLFAGIYRNSFPNSFRRSFANPLSYKMRSISVDDAYASFGSIDNILSVLLLGGFISFVYLQSFPFLDLGLSGILLPIIKWGLGALLIGVAIFIKYAWSKLISTLFSFKALSNVQNQDFTHFMILVLFGASILKMVDFFTWGKYHQSLMSMIFYLIIISLIFFAVWLTLKFHKYYNHRKLMIISYLCTTEFLPSFIAIYWLVN